MTSHARPAAADGALQAYLRGMRRKAEALVRAWAVDLRTQSVAVRATLDADGWVCGLAVVRSSGSQSVDRLVEGALATMFVDAPPAALVGIDLTLDLGAPPPTRA